MLVAALLGLSAFLADFVDGPAGRLMVVLTSSGFAWGLAGFLVARSTPYGAGAAVRRSTALLITATVVYYSLILVGTRRWMAGGVVAEGLLDVGLMTAVWVAGSVVAGVVLGILGCLVRRDGLTEHEHLGLRSREDGRAGREQSGSAAGEGGQADRGRSGSTVSEGGEVDRGQVGLTMRNNPAIAAGALGLACGLLAGQGLARAAVARPWWLSGGRSEFFAAFGLGELLMIGLPLGVLVWLATAHRLWRAWPVLLGAGAGAAGGSAVCWVLVEQVAQYAIHGQPIGL
ncbi:hypothetical protein C8E87_7745 [Paractinoplanes brasiliensis]|uniref:Uncharacterized protein n=1 Tax=Paractinoplanes brasiliensis TaxID=52695 RepID=A0A4R6J9K0_9ACTN|nr:hypothetical protein C8E87_7745 [Actinoplanes brasiliensis]GID27843.1 hypothetical protein Abr02nite_28260 [Actinoplanes brasiliensis]